MKILRCILQFAFDHMINSATHIPILFPFWTIIQTKNKANINQGEIMETKQHKKLRRNN